MPDSAIAGDVLFQTDDDLSQANLAVVLGKASALSDFVSSGLTFTVNHTSNELDISTGKAYILNSGDEYVVQPNAASGISLPDTNGTNHVFLAVDPSSQDDIYYHLDTDDSAPADPNIKIGTVDTAGDSHTELNRTLSIDTSELVDGSVTTAKLAADAVTAAKILDGEVNTAELASNAVTNVKMADDSVTVVEIDLDDDDELLWGTDDDISERYDSAEDEMKWQDNTGAADRMSLARTTGDLVIDGTLDETSAP